MTPYRETDNRPLAEQTSYQEDRIAALKGRVAELEMQRDGYASIVKRLERRLSILMQERQTFWCREHGDFWHHEGAAETAVCPRCEAGAVEEIEFAAQVAEEREDRYAE